MKFRRGINVYIDVIGKVLPSVVPIGYAYVIKKPSDLRVAKAEFAVIGSGFAVKDGNLIATCAHVVHGVPNYADLVIGLMDADDALQWYTADIVACEGRQIATLPSLCFPDVALLTIRDEVICGNRNRTDFCVGDVPEGQRPKLRPLMLGTGEDLQVGEEVVFIGYPMGGSVGMPIEDMPVGMPRNASSYSRLGMEASATTAIISAIRRGHALGRHRNFATAINLLELDSASNPGNSGGPVISVRSGEVIGFITFGSPALVASSFAYPADLVTAVMEQIT